MKRALIIVLMVLMTIGLIGVFGCGTKTETTVLDNDTPNQKEEQPKAPIPEPQPQGIPWEQAVHHVGERTTVYGPVVSTKWASSSRGQPTFLNIGRAYPDSNRFTVVIWIQNRGNFSSAPENYYDGKTISVNGLIDTYEGVPQIEVSSPSQIQEW